MCGGVCVCAYVRACRECCVGCSELAAGGGQLPRASLRARAALRRLLAEGTTCAHAQAFCRGAAGHAKAWADRCLKRAKTLARKMGSGQMAGFRDCICLPVHFASGLQQVTFMSYRNLPFFMHVSMQA